MTDSERTGVVIGGGFSTRFGDDDKALATVDGDPMLARVVARVGDAVGTVVVNCRPEQRAAFERALDVREDTPPVRFALDPEPDQGPLAGLLTALEGIDTEYVAVVACDMPWVAPTFLDSLFERARGRDAAVPELRDGTLQPVQAVYRTNAMRLAAADQLAANRRSLHGTLDHLDVTVVPADEVQRWTSWRSLQDVNTKAEIDSLGGT